MWAGEREGEREIRFALEKPHTAIAYSNVRVHREMLVPMSIYMRVNYAEK